VNRIAGWLARLKRHLGWNRRDEEMPARSGVDSGRLWWYDASRLL